MSLAYGGRQPCDPGLAEARGRTIPCPQRDKPWVLATAILGSSLAFIEGSVVNLALPAVQSGFGADSSDVQWVMNAYLLVLGSFMLIGGSLGDRFGLRRIFITGTIVFGLGALAAAVATSMPLLVAARLVQGLGGALLVPTSLALIGSHFEEHERGRAIGTWAGASALTTALGPVLGGWLVDQWGWPAVFLLVVPLAAITIAICWWRVPVSPARTREALDYPGALLLAASLGLLIYGLVAALPGIGRTILLALSVILGAGFLWREQRFHAPMLPLRLFRSPVFSGANAMTFLLYAALSGTLFFLPFNLIQVQGYSATQAGAAFLPFSLVMGLGSTFAGDRIREGDPRRLLTTGPLIAALGFVALAIPGQDAGYVSGFLPGILLVGVGMTLAVAPLTTVVMSSVGAVESGLASGVNNTAARVAGTVAIAALTAVAAWHFGGALPGELQARDVPPRLAGELAQRASRLAELEAPDGTPAPVAVAVSGAVASAYVETFRVLALICAALAAASGAIAWFSMGRQADRAQPARLNKE
jgi:EmrB/QacA subfamily drug resistance transporter